MININKFGVISAAIMALYSAPVVMAQSEIFDPSDESSVVTLTPSKELDSETQNEILDSEWGDLSYQYNLKKQDQASADQEAYNNGWAKYAKDTAIGTAKFTGQKLWDTASYAARTALAWNINYYGLETIEEAVAYTAYGLGTLGAGPAAGSGAYYTTKGVLKVARYVVPGFEGYISGALAPVTKTLIVDPIINYGPAVVSKAASVGVSGTKAAISGLSSLYSYWRG